MNRSGASDPSGDNSKPSGSSGALPLSRVFSEPHQLRQAGVIGRRVATWTSLASSVGAPSASGGVEGSTTI